MEPETRIKRLRFRAHHRGTREADLLIGGFFDAHHPGWDEADCAWFEALLDEQDADVLMWAMGTAEAPAKYEGSMMLALRDTGYVPISK